MYFIIYNLLYRYSYYYFCHVLSINKIPSHYFICQIFYTVKSVQIFVQIETPERVKKYFMQDKRPNLQKISSN